MTKVRNIKISLETASTKLTREQMSDEIDKAK
jgi:hypothetical protein